MEETTNTIRNIFQKNDIDQIAFISAADCYVRNKKLFSEIAPKTCICFLIPYRTINNNPRYISKYSSVKDYHLFSKITMDSVCNELSKHYPLNSFLPFTDSSPLNEKTTAAKAGLGVIGKNYLLINKKYGSYIFIGTILTDLYIECQTSDIRSCIGCNACIDACPTGCLKTGDFSTCLSYITQKKVRSDEELSLIIQHECAWGCDACQDCCPYNKEAQLTDIDFFKNELLNDISSEQIQSMTDKEFSQRAFSWRPKNVILENLRAIEGKKKPK